jgi:hypothetical protein
MPKPSSANLTARIILSGCTFSARISPGLYLSEHSGSPHTQYIRSGVADEAFGGGQRPDWTLAQVVAGQSWETRAPEKGDGAGARRPHGLTAAVGKGPLSRTKTLKSALGAQSGRSEPQL